MDKAGVRQPVNSAGIYLEVVLTPLDETERFCSLGQQPARGLPALSTIDHQDRSGPHEAIALLDQRQ